MINGERISLRAIQRKDSDRILNWVNNSELRNLTGGIYPVSDIEHEIWFKDKALEKTNKLFGIEKRDEKALIGIIGFNNTDFINRSTEVYIYLGEPLYWGKGMGTEALQLMTNFAFEELNLHRLFLTVFSYNSRAIKSYEKVGFIKEGVLRDSIYKSGKYYDKVIMSIINTK